MVVFDASFLIPLFDPKANEPEPGARRKLNYLFAELEKAKERIVIPTPALSEYLVKAGEAGPKYLAVMSKSPSFRVADFDIRAAVEAAAMIKEAIGSGDKRSGLKTDWQVIKYDRQIVAIARVEGVSRIYSNDPDFKKLVGPNGPQVLAFADLPSPPEESQGSLDFDEDVDKD
ncbi:MAG: type II toxin-antitoxin system VapC family toxin [Rhodomicrobium sp.]